MSLKKIFYLSILIACCQVPMAQAGLITLNEFDSGEVVYRRVGFFCNGTESASHSSGLDNLSTEIRPCGILGSLITTQTWGYLIFDLAPVTGTVNSATVSFTIDALTGVDGTINLFDYTLTSATALASLAEGLLPTAFAADFHNDISSGNLLGSERLTTSSSPGVYDLELSSYALDQINSAGGLFAIGVSYFQSTEGDLFYEEIGIAGPTQLNLQIANIPVPATLGLFVTGLIGLASPRRKRALTNR
ncbi:MAG: hypothetical protein CME59_15500 [Halioglobus sp.]|nr:hypothetical protein [Halioglobus sp.]|tara:strand:+ start:3422 stop:4162 length:741 start_codon:yes stop_codon:yes gene_type:complete